MDLKFAVKKSSSFGYLLMIISVLIGFVAIGLPVLTNDSLSADELLISIIITTLFGGLFLWIWFDTYYIIENETLIAKSGPMIWKVRIKDISFIRLNQKTIGGIWKPTLSWDCIEVKYKKYRSISITPDKQDDFIDRLKKLNDNIEIKEK